MHLREIFRNYLVQDQFWKKKKIRGMKILRKIICRLFFKSLNKVKTSACSLKIFGVRHNRTRAISPPGYKMEVPYQRLHSISLKSFSSNLMHLPHSGCVCVYVMFKISSAVLNLRQFILRSKNTSEKAWVARTENSESFMLL